MKRICCLLLALGLGLLGAGQTWAYTFLQDQTSSGKWYPDRWLASTTKVRWELNSTPLDLLPNILSDAAPREAIEAAMQTWAAVAPPQFYLDGPVATQNAAKDGVNLITLADTPQNRDATSDSTSTTFVWIKNTKPVSQPYWDLQETDIVVNPADQWDTNSDPNSFDLQSILTHEMGHAHGLGHSPVIGATMFSAGYPGRTDRRVLQADDVAGISTLYNLPTPGDGALTGKVVGADGKPVFGADVVALDQNGFVPTVALTGKDGSFKLTCLPAGGYSVYVEPLVGAFRSNQLPSDYYGGLRTDFLTRFAGDENTPPYHVTAGDTTTIDPIAVDAGTPTLIPQSIAASDDGNPANVYGTSMVVSPGSNGYLTVVGPGLDTATEIGVTGSDVALETSNAYVGAWNTGTYYITLPFTVSATARPGVHTLLLGSDTEIAAYTGGIKVVAP